MKLLISNLKNKVGIEESVSLLSSLDLPKALDGKAIGLATSPMAIPFLPIKNNHVLLAAQNVGWTASHALTGETMAEDLVLKGIRHCIIGHSERRLYLNENEDIIANRLEACFEHGITPVLCVGETYDEFNSGQTWTVLKRQLQTLERALSSTQKRAQPNSFVIAYEPMWAISTSGIGKTLSPSGANAIHIKIRAILKRMFSQISEADFTVLYGGSLNAKNCEDYFKQSSIDGGLVGSGMQSADGFMAVSASFIRSC